MKYNVVDQTIEFKQTPILTESILPINHSISPMKNRWVVVVDDVIYVLHEKHDPKNQNEFYNKIEWIINTHNVNLHFN